MFEYFEGVVFFLAFEAFFLGGLEDEDFDCIETGSNFEPFFLYIAIEFYL